MRCHTLYLLLLLSLYGCRVGPRYHQPIVETPIQWKGVETAGNDPIVPLATNQWWIVFDDERLNELEGTAVCNNPDLFTAMARIEEGWAVAGVKRADLFPQVDVTPSFSQTNELFKIYLPKNFNFPVLSQDLSQPFRIHDYQYALPFNLRYELDLWGKYRNQHCSAFRSAQAEEEAYQTALLTLTSQVASSYFHLRTLDVTIDLLRQTIAARQKTLELAQSRFDAGLISYADVSSATLERCNTEAELEEAIRLRSLQENLLATFLGIPASEFQLEAAPFNARLPTIPAGLPSSILRRRPDIAEAERNMAAQHALVGVAYADFFPAITLTSSVGFFSPTLQDFLTWQSRLFSIALSAFQTLFDAGRRRNHLRAEWARFAQASGAYQKQVITAFEEVENALVNLEYQQQQSNSLLCSVESANQLIALSMNRYKIGVTNYIEVVNNERSALDAQRAYVTLTGERFQSTIQLIKALGGGWDDPCTTIAAAATPVDGEKTTRLPPR